MRFRHNTRSGGDAGDCSVFPSLLEGPFHSKKAVNELDAERDHRAIDTRSLLSIH